MTLGARYGDPRTVHNVDQLRDAILADAGDNLLTWMRHDGRVEVTYEQLERQVSEWRKQARRR